MASKSVLIPCAHWLIFFSSACIEQELTVRRQPDGNVCLDSNDNIGFASRQWQIVEFQVHLQLIDGETAQIIILSKLFPVRLRHKHSWIFLSFHFAFLSRWKCRLLALCSIDRCLERHDCIFMLSHRLFAGKRFIHEVCNVWDVFS